MVEDVRLLGDGIDVEAEIHKLILRCILDSPEKPAPNPVRITLRITCGPRRARTLPGTVRGDAGRSYHRKVRDRPDRQVHALVSRRHCLAFRGHAARAYPGSFTADRTPPAG